MKDTDPGGMLNPLPFDRQVLVAGIECPKCWGNSNGMSFKYVYTQYGELLVIMCVSCTASIAYMSPADAPPE